MGKGSNLFPTQGKKEGIMARPIFTASGEQRRLVKSMAGFGINQEGIAMTLEISPHTLRKHFRKELDRGAIEANAQVANALFKMASSGKVPAATIFWVKTRCGWRERPVLEASEIVPPQFHIRIEEPSS
jgi:hypothetical protein